MEIESKIAARCIDSVRLPLEHFIKTGFWDPWVVPGNFDHVADLRDDFVRRICRNVAKELDRPFIICTGHIPPGGTSASGYLQMPKVKKLACIVAPFALAASPGGLVCDDSTKTRWEFRVSDQELWTKLYDFVLNDPDCRKARNMPVTG